MFHNLFCSSSVNRETEKVMQDVIETEFKSQTVPVAIKQQRIVEQGPFEQLATRDGEFSKLFS